MEDNVIDIYGYIDSVSMDDNIVSPQHISKQLKKMQDAGNITVNINSNGGDVFSGIAIYNMLKNTLRISPLISMVLLLL
ncbi:ATP-dependent protease ClpP protease subunit [Staphylococcus auricularis]|uniref:ATP-dependent Clp protease proteolytic subunit n=1 Tax=Staphylococcus auricularis TaxID=29379 RepID=UPI0030B8C970